jgi:hypothetical protein
MAAFIFKNSPYVFIKFLPVLWKQSVFVIFRRENDLIKNLGVGFHIGNVYSTASRLGIPGKM